MTAPANEEQLPVLALVYGGMERDHSPMRFAEAAHGVCSILWVIPPGDIPPSRASLRFLRGIGSVIDGGDAPLSKTANEIRAHAPAGIACFIDSHLVWTAAMAELLGLPFHSEPTATQLTDKLEQRRGFQAYGLRTPPFWDVDDLTGEAGIAAVLEHAGLPVVIKPRHGTSSDGVRALRSVGELRAALDHPERGRMILEGFIPDSLTPVTGEGNAPYASVEVVVSDGAMSVLAVMGRSALVEPFRETGSFIPADVAPEIEAELIDSAVSAARALGIVIGVLHVEVKCTDDGPVVIEVNGRPGGGEIPALIKRSSGIDTLRWAMRVALGESAVNVDALPPKEVVFSIGVQPDEHLRHITAVDGLDSVRNIPGVEQVARGVGIGEEMAGRAGTSYAAVAAVIGVAPDHATARRVRDEVLARIVISGTP